MNKKKAFIPMSVLIGALLLALVATMTPFVAEPDVAHAQALSADATLSDLTVVGGPSDSAVVALAPSFDAATEKYTVRIGFNDSGVTVTPTAVSGNAGNPDASRNSIIRVNGKMVTSGEGEVVDLGRRAGMTTDITIHVTAPQRSATKTYTVKVYRERQTKSTNANLASLGLSGVSLSPAFTPGTTSYKARVQAATVTLSRQNLSDTGGGASIVDIGAAYKTGDSGTATPGYDSASKKVTLGDEATSTVITVRVTPESVLPADATSCDIAGVQCYTIEVYRIRANRETDATLALSSDSPAGLTISTIPAAGFVSPSAAGDVYDTTTAAVKTSSKLRVNNDTTHVTVAANAADPGATYVISPSDARAGMGDGLTGHQVALRVGAETTITITVTAEDTARIQTYTVKVYRERATKSQDNNLNSLSLSVGTLTPVFDRDKIGYTAQVAHDVDKVTVSYAASDTAGGSSVVVASTADTDGVTNNEVDLAAAGTASSITVTVTPECGAASSTPGEECAGPKIYTITLYRLRELPSANASLAGLGLPTGVNPTPAFIATTKMYKASVANNVASITVNPTAVDAALGATVVTTPKGGVSVDLTAGMETLITITVTAEDRTTTDTYMVYVYRQRATLSEDATLSALSLSAGMLSPAFMSDTMGYKARVASSVSEVTVSATANDNAGGVSIARATSTDNAICEATDTAVTTAAIPLGGEGTNTNICVNVTAEDGSTIKRYLVQVYRLRINPSADDGLTAFTIAEATGSINITTGVREASTATKDLLSENDPDVAYVVRQVTVVATADVGAVVTILPADADTSRPGHQVDLSAGAETTITVLVQPEDSSVPSKAHTANVYRMNVPGSESKDNTLSSLMLSGAELSPMFASATTKYTAAAANSTELTTVTAMATHIGAQSSVMITPDDANADMDGHQVRLTAGQDTDIMVSVTAEAGGTAKMYTVKVTRAAEESSDATLESLSLSGLTLMPEFDPATTGYTAEIDFLETTTVEAMAAHHAATVEGTGEKTLVVGENMISVMVTAEDESTETYTVTVTVLRGETLLQRYDENNNGRIDLAEARMAVDDYLFNDVLTKEQAQEVVNLYLFG